MGEMDWMEFYRKQKQDKIDKQSTDIYNTVLLLSIAALLLLLSLVEL